MQNPTKNTSASKVKEQEKKHSRGDEEVSGRKGAGKTDQQQASTQISKGKMMHMTKCKTTQSLLGDKKLMAINCYTVELLYGPLKRVKPSHRLSVSSCVSMFARHKGHTLKLGV